MNIPQLFIRHGERRLGALHPRDLVNRRETHALTLAVEVRPLHTNSWGVSQPMRLCDT